MDDLPVESLGPKMLALTPLQRRYAYLRGLGQENAAQAARDAGYSDVKEGAKVRASELRQNPAVLEAILEVGRKELSGLAPVAIAVFRDVLTNEKHPKRLEVAGTVLALSGFNPKTEHKVTVEHTIDTREIEELARRLAAESGVPVDKLIGTNKPMKVIEHEAQTQSVREDHGQAGNRDGTQDASEGA